MNTIKQYKVVKLQRGGQKEVEASEVEVVLNRFATQGWKLSQMSTGGLSYDEYQSYEWVYLVFEKD